MKLSITDSFTVTIYQDAKEIKTSGMNTETLINTWPKITRWINGNPKTRGVKVSRGKLNFSASEVTQGIIKFRVSQECLAMA